MHPHVVLHISGALSLKVNLPNRIIQPLFSPLCTPLHIPMTRDTAVRHQQTDDDEAIRTTVISSSPSESSGTHDHIHKMQKEIISPVLATPVPSRDTIRNAEKQNPRTRKQKRAEVLQLMALYWSIFYVGCNDGSIGPLVPRIQQVYQVNVPNLCRKLVALTSFIR